MAKPKRKGGPKQQLSPTGALERLLETYVMLKAGYGMEILVHALNLEKAHRQVLCKEKRKRQRIKEKGRIAQLIYTMLVVN